jgi:hypothetical protein
MRLHDKVVSNFQIQLCLIQNSRRLLTFFFYAHLRACTLSKVYSVLGIEEYLSSSGSITKAIFERHSRVKLMTPLVFHRNNKFCNLRGKYHC